MSREDFASLMEAALSDDRSRMRRRLEVGSTVEGTVIAVGGDTVFVDVGATKDARVPRGELLLPNGELRVKPGDRLRAVVKQLGSEGPELAVALGRGGGALDVATLELARDAGTPVEGKVLRAVKGGLEVEVAGVRCFCPASQVDLAYQADLSTWEGRTLELAVLEVKEGGRTVVVSRRALLEKERAQRAEEVLARLAPGQEVGGAVVSLNKHGAVIDLGGVEGFVHVSELSHARVASVEDVVSVGASVRAQVLSIEPGARGPQIRLSLKALVQPDVPAAPERDEILGGSVVRHGSFGVVVETAKGEGLVPVRELGLPPGSDHRRAFPVGTQVTVVLLSRDERSGKLRFSVKGVASVEERKNYREFSAEQRQRGAGGGAALGSFGALLRQKLGLPEPAPAAPEARAASGPGAAPVEPAPPPAQVAQERAGAASGASAGSAPTAVVDRSPRAAEPGTRAPGAARRPRHDPPGVLRRRR